MQHRRQRIQQPGEQPVVAAIEYTLAEISVDRFPQRDEISRVFRWHRRDVAEQGAFGAEFGGGSWKAPHLVTGRKAVDPPRGVVAQNDAVGDIECQRAAGKAVRGPRKAHDENITG